MAPPRDRIWITDTASFFFTSACTSAGSARPEVSRMISPIRKVIGLLSPARMEATIPGIRRHDLLHVAAEDGRVGDLLPALLPDDGNAGPCPPRTPFPAPTWRSFRGCASDARSPSSSASRRCVSGLAERLVPVRFRCFFTSAASQSAALCGSAPSSDGLLEVVGGGLLLAEEVRLVLGKRKTAP